MGLGNNAVVSSDGGRGGVLLVNLFFLKIDTACWKSPTKYFLNKPID